jgi:hypothetical protein
MNLFTRLFCGFEIVLFGAGWLLHEPHAVGISRAMQARCRSAKRAKRSGETDIA